MFLALLFSLPPMTSSASSETASKAKKDQVTQIESELSREKEQFLEFGIKEKSLLGQLSDIENEINKKRKLLRDLKEKIHFNKKGLKSRQRALRRLERSLILAKKRLGKRLRALYKYSKRGYVQLLTSSKDLGQLRKRMKCLRIIVGVDKGLQQSMVKGEQKYKKEIILIQERLAMIASLEKAEKNKVRSIKENLDQKVVLLMKIHKEREFYETAVKELQFAAKKLRQTLLDLDRKKAKKTLPTDFGGSKGKLPLPFNGKIIKNKTRLGAEIVSIKKGIFIEGPMGAGVQAVYPGRVDFSGLIKGYGETIVINHGSRFFTVSAHLAQRKKETGDMVERGDLIGILGQTDGFSGPRLYFEMRWAEANLDPLKWLKVD